MANKHITAAKIGLNPNDANILAGIATAVPYPATASKNPPNPHANIKTWILLSVVILESIVFITSIVFVSTAKL